MKAARLVAHGAPLEVGEVDEPVPGPADAVVRVEAAGICRSDWHVWQGDWAWIGLRARLPVTLGHEFAGTVVAVGSGVKRVRAGDRVTAPFHEACGSCRACRDGLTNMCARVRILGLAHDGAHAELVLIPDADVNCVALPDGIDARTAAAIGCRYMTAYRAVTARGGVRAGQWVAVHGAGGVGLSAVQVAAVAGAQVVAVDVDEAKLAKAREEGATATVDARAGKVPRAIRELTGGGAHVSIDALGIAETTLNSVLCLRKRGRHVQVGLTTGAEEGMVALPMDRIVSMELEIAGSMGNPHSRYDGLLALVAAGRLRPATLVTQEVPLEQVSDVLTAMSTFGTVGFAVVTRF